MNFCWEVFINNPQHPTTTPLSLGTKSAKQYVKLLEAGGPYSRDIHQNIGNVPVIRIIIKRLIMINLTTGFWQLFWNTICVCRQTTRWAPAWRKWQGSQFIVSQKNSGKGKSSKFLQQMISNETKNRWYDDSVQMLLRWAWRRLGILVQSCRQKVKKSNVSESTVLKIIRFYIWTVICLAGMYAGGGEFFHGTFEVRLVCAVQAHPLAQVVL